MPIQIQCPQCGRQLRVPDSLRGKRVQCPSCQHMFVSDGPTPTEDAGWEVVDDDAPAAPGPAAPASGARKPSDLLSQMPSRPPTSRRDEDDEDERPARRRRDEDDDEEEEEERRPRRGGKRAKAEAKVLGPAIALMILGGIWVGLSILDVGLRVTGVLEPAGGPAAPAGVDAKAFQTGVVIGKAGAVVVDIIMIGLSALVIYGAVQMKNLESRGMAMASCVISIVPCFCCCFGIPFGIWGITAMNDPVVKRYMS
jgi:predicted Zn finger-like uncharacterized protein